MPRIVDALPNGPVGHPTVRVFLAGALEATTSYACWAVTHLARHVEAQHELYDAVKGKPLVLLAGHTDTVPAQGNFPGRVEDGAVVGLGASDMKGGLAVMIELANWAADAELAYDLALLFFPREELGPAENPLPAV